MPPVTFALPPIAGKALRRPTSIKDNLPASIPFRGTAD